MSTSLPKQKINYFPEVVEEKIPRIVRDKISNLPQQQSLKLPKKISRLSTDEDYELMKKAKRWITLHPHGKGTEPAVRVLIEDRTGEVVSGAGGKLKGRKLTNARSLPLEQLKKMPKEKPKKVAKLVEEKISEDKKPEVKTKKVEILPGVKPKEKKTWLSRIGDVLGRVRDFFLSHRRAETESVQDILNDIERIVRIIHALQTLKEDAQGKIEIPQIEDEPNKDKIGQYKSVNVDRMPDVKISTAAKKQQVNEVNKYSKTINSSLKKIGLTAKEPIISPRIVTYEVQVKTEKDAKKLKALQEDLSIRLKKNIRMFKSDSPDVYNIEIPTDAVVPVTLKTAISSIASAKKKDPTGTYTFIGVDTENKPRLINLNKENNAHILIGATTGAGKSVLLRSMVYGLVSNYSPKEVQLVILDPKKGLTFSEFERSPHLKYPIASDGETALHTMNKVFQEMYRRYDLFREMERKLPKGTKVETLEAYNRYAEKLGMEKLPRLVIVNDEISILRDVLGNIPAKNRKTATALFDKSMKDVGMLGRAAGVHIIAATQKPTAENLPSSLKSVSCRIALKTADAQDSRNIIDESGAEKLLGKGDGLFIDPSTGKKVRFQATFPQEEEMKYVLDNIGL